jgi:hypothetical protein
LVGRKPIGEEERNVLATAAGERLKEDLEKLSTSLLSITVFMSSR